MLVIVMALACSVAYGLTDFMGGLAARRAHILLLGALTQVVGLVLLAVVVGIVPGTFSVTAVSWGLVSGLGGVMAYVLLFRSLAIGPMSVASPLSALTAAVIPVCVGFLLGERLGGWAWTGIVVGLIAVLMVSRQRDENPHPVTAQVVGMSIGAGLFISVFLIGLERSPADSGLWTVLVGKATTMLILLVAAIATRRLTRPSLIVLRLGMASASLDVLATVLFLLATREGTLTVVTVITALYPAATVLMAKLVLKEQLHGVQRLGLALAVASVSLLAVAS